MTGSPENSSYQPPVDQTESQRPKEFNRPGAFFEGKLADACRRVDPKYVDRLPDDYLYIQRSLITREIEGKEGILTRFCGGPMSWGRFGIEDGWLNPFSYFDRKTPERPGVNFHVLTINCDRGNDCSEAEIVFNFATDDELKLSAYDPQAEAIDLKMAIAGAKDKKMVIIRPALCGSLAFPLISSPDDIAEGKVDADFIMNGIRELMSNYGFQFDEGEIRSRLEHLLEKQAFRAKADLDKGRKLGEERMITTEKGQFYINEVISEPKAWRVYRIYSAQPLESIDRSQPVYIRVDSGCDIGMNYMDQGCDCHSQLLNALDEVQSRNGLVIHLPTQDGRGFGANTKSYTEGLKHGIDPRTNESIPPMDTVRAAKVIFGDGYDIRSYAEAGGIMKSLGFDRIKLLTDNNKKKYAIGRVVGEDNLEVIPTNTIARMIQDKVQADTVIQMFLKELNDGYALSREEAMKTIEKIFGYIGVYDKMSLPFESQVDYLRGVLSSGEL